MSTNKSSGHHPHRQIAKNAGIVGLATLCSRILGFLRDIVIARLFGVYVYAQAFVVAFKIPNLFRDFLGEGAANAALVPVFSEYRAKHTKEEFWELVNVVLNILLVILGAVTLLGIIFSPLLVRLTAPGFIADPYKLATTIRLNQIIFPYLLLVCLAAYAMAILNSLGNFSVSAFAPCFLNISIIVFAMLFGQGIKGLASGILVGGLLQLLVQVPTLRRKGMRFDFFKKFRHPQLKPIGKLMLPRILSSSIYQLNNFVDSIFGSLSSIVGEGGVAGLYFAYRLILFPLGIFSTSLAQVLLPAFSLQALESDFTRMRHSLSFGLRATFFVIVPASVALGILAEPIIATIFAGGKFDAYSVKMTARILSFYSIGLFAYASTRILQSCFFALKDTLTPAKNSALSLVLNIIFNAILMFPMKLAGIALATSLSGIITCGFLFYILQKKIAFKEKSEVYASFLRILAASILMGLVCGILAQKINFSSGNLVYKYMHLGVLILTGVTAYFVFCWLLGVREIRMLLPVLRKVFKSKSEKKEVFPDE